jgi:uncharacterized protein YjbI with pentapeptide repeats
MKIVLPHIPAVLELLHSSAILPETLERVQVELAVWAGHERRRMSLDVVRLINGDLMGAKLRDGSWADVHISSGMLAGVDLTGTSWRRVEASGIRADGLVAAETSGRDITIRDSKLDLANFRHAKWSRTQFINCSLREADFMAAQFTEVRFENCDLTRTQFSGAVLNHVDLRGSRLEDIDGIAGLAGATISQEQLMHLAPELARVLELNVDDGDN